MERLRKSVYVVVLLGLIITFLFVASSVVLPLALAGLLAMLFRGWSNRLEKKGLKRWHTALISVSILLAAIALVVGLLAWQLTTFTDNLGEIQERLTQRFTAMQEWVQETAGISQSRQDEMIEEQAQAATSTATPGANGSSGGIAAFAAGTLAFAVDFILLIVYTFLLLYYRSRIKAFILMITPDENRDDTITITENSSRVAQQYLGGLMAMISVLWVLYGIGFSIVGVEGAIFFAVLCGLLEIIPFVGNLLGTTITVVAVVAQGGDSGMILGVIGVYLLVQGLQTYILEPLIVGKQVRINALTTIIALVAGELLWGIAGMILAIPIVGIIKIICDHITPLNPYGYVMGSENSKHVKP